MSRFSRFALGLAFFLLVPSVAATPNQLTFTDAIGQGSFGLLPQGNATIVTTGRVLWQLSAVSAHITVVDDREENAVPNPLNSDSSLVATVTSNTTHLDLRNVQLEWSTNADDSVSILQGSHLGANTTNKLTFNWTIAKNVEQSHFISASAIGNQNLQYAISVPSGVAESAGSSQLHASQNVRLYSWNARINIKHDGGEFGLTTGRFDDMSVSQGSLRTRHWVHAFIELEGTSADLTSPNQALYATSLTLASSGSLSFNNAKGTILTNSGPQEATGNQVTAVAGSFSVAGTNSQLKASVNEIPQSTSGVQPLPGLSSIKAYWIASGIITGLFIAIVLAPTLYGGRFTEAGQSPRSRRAEAYAAWAAISDTRGWKWLASWNAGRAVRNQPLAPELRVEYGILLRQAGHPIQAITEHEMAHTLLLRQPDPGCGALNDFNAALCCAEMGRLDEAMEWLQGAVEKDPRLAREAASMPTLRVLRAHPDYGSVIGH